MIITLTQLYSSVFFYLYIYYYFYYIFVEVSFALGSIGKKSSYLFYFDADSIPFCRYILFLLMTVISSVLVNPKLLIGFLDWEQILLVVFLYRPLFLVPFSFFIVHVLCNFHTFDTHISTLVEEQILCLFFFFCRGYFFLVPCFSSSCLTFCAIAILFAYCKKLQKKSGGSTL